ncbi:MAG: glutathione S-transferase family protein [Pseudomonadota bacterium]
MFDLYTHATPNGYKPTMALETLGLTYETHTIDSRGGITDPTLLAMNPNAKIPILFDRERQISVYESGAILLYLAKISGALFPPEEDLAAHADGLQKLFFASAWLGPMFGQRMQYAFFEEGVQAHGIRRYEREGHRTTHVAQDMLGEAEWFLPMGFSIVDIAIFAWLHTANLVGYVPEDAFPTLRAWMARVETRPAIAKALTIPMDRRDLPMPPRKVVESVA